LLGRDDDYRSAGKPICDYDDPAAREALVHALAEDARALLGALDGRELSDAVGRAAALLAAVVGQDLERGEDDVFRMRAGSLRTASSRPSIPTRVTATRPPQGALTATRATSPWTPTAN